MTDPAFDLAAVEERVTTVVSNQQATQIVIRFFAELQTRTARRLADGTVFLVTGDIPAMWLRDSAAQLMPLLRIGAGPAAEEFAIAVLRRQLDYILLDPYANAFLSTARDKSRWETDQTQMRPGVYERKYELDSLCSVLRLSVGYFRACGDSSCFDGDWQRAVASILSTIRGEQRGSDEASTSPYRFARKALRANR